MKVFTPHSLILIVLFFVLGQNSSARILNQSRQVITKNDLQENITQHLKTRIPPEIVEYKIDVKRLPETIQVPKGPLKIDIKVISSRKIKGNVILQILVYVNQACFKKITTTVHIVTFEKVVVAQKNFARHEKIEPDDLRIEHRETTELDGAVFHSIEQLTGFRITRTIQDGSILTDNKVEPIPLIKRGEIVTLVLKWDNLYVTALGKALKDGYKNEIISVKNLDSKKYLKGEVIELRKVLIRP